MQCHSSMADRSSSPAVKHAFWSLLTLLMGLLTTAPAQTPPPNDNRANAIELTGTSGSIAVDTTYATAEPGEPAHWNSPHHSVWFRVGFDRWTTVHLNTCTYSFDTVIAVYRESDMTPIIRNDDSCEVGSIVSFAAGPETAYLIAVDGYATTSGVCTLAYSTVANSGPENDNFESARPYANLGFSDSGYNAYATSQPGEPRPSARTPQSVWYRWTPSQPGETLVESYPSSTVDHDLVVYTGSQLESLVPVATTVVAGQGRRATFTATAGVSYSIQLSTYAGGLSSVPFSIFPPPTNDLIANAAVLTGDTGTTTGTTRWATASPGDPNIVGSWRSRTVWYRWEAPEQGVYLFQTTAGFLGAFGGPQAALTNNPIVESYGSAERVLAEAGSVWWIPVGSDGSGESFSLSYIKQSPPSNDAPETATVIAGQTGSATGSFVGSGPTPSENGLGLGWHSVWYRWTAPATGEVRISSDWYVDFWLASPDGLRPQGSALGDTRFVTAGDTLLIAVSRSFAASPGTFSLNWEMPLPPPNDLIANAAVLTGDAGTTTGTTRLATASPGDPNISGSQRSRTVWYRWEAPEQGVYLFQTTGYIGAFGGPPAALTNNPIVESYGSAERVLAEAGSIWWIAVGNYYSEGESFTLSYIKQSPPSNDAPETATVIAGQTGSTTGSFVGSGPMPSENGLALGWHSVWYRWTAPASGQAQFSLGNGAVSTWLASPDGRGPQGSALGSAPSVTAGDTLLIAVHQGFAASPGTFSLNWEMTLPPPNDLIENAAVLTGDAGTTTGTTRLATASPGDPNIFGSQRPRTVWYRWEAPEQGVYLFQTTAESIGAFGGSQAALTNNPIVDSYWREERVLAEAGSVWWIAVGNYYSEGESFTLSHVRESPPSNDAPETATVIAGQTGSTWGTSVGSGPMPSENGLPLEWHSVWYRWTAPATGVVQFDFSNVGWINSWLASPDGRRPQGSALGRAPFVTAGDTLLIAVHQDFSASAGTFLLSWELAVAPPNDLVANAAVLTGAAGTTTGTTRGATASPGDPNISGSQRSRTVWYRWEAPEQGVYLFQTTAGYIGAFGGPQAALTNNPIVESYRSAERVLAEAGSVWWIAVGNYYSEGESFTLSYVKQSPPSNDVPETATPIAGQTGSTTGSFVGSGPTPSENGLALGWHSVWYRWTAPASGQAQFSLGNGAVSTWLASPDGRGPQGSALGSAPSVTAGDTLLIAVHQGFAASPGTFLLSWETAVPPPNDLIANAAVLTGDDGTTVGSTRAASRTGGDPSEHASNVWYRWTAPSTGVYTFSTCRGSSNFIQARLTVHTLNESGVLGSVPVQGRTICNGRETIELAAVQGTNYLLAVYTTDASSGGTFNLDWARSRVAENPVVVMGQGELLASALAPDGRHVLTSGSAGTYLRDFETGTLVRHLREAGDWVVGVAFSPDGSMLATGSYDRKVKLWEVATGRLVRRIDGHTGWVECVAFSRDGTMLASGSRDSDVRLVRPDTGELIRVLPQATGTIGAVAFSPDGALVAAASYDRSAYVWRVADGSLVFSVPHNGEVRSVAFSPDGRELLTSSHDTRVRRISVETGSVIAELRGHTLAVLSAVWSPDGTRIVSGGVDRRVIEWNLDGSIAGEFVGHTNSVLDVEFSTDGTKLLTSSRDLTARLWNPATRTEIGQVGGHTSHINALDVAPDGTTIISGSEDGIGRYWNTETGDPGQRLVGHFSQILDLDISPDGDSVLTGSRDGTARLWEFDTARQVGRYHESSYDSRAETRYDVRSVEFSADSRRMLTAGGNGWAKERLRSDGSLYSNRWYSLALNSVRYHPTGIWFVLFSEPFISARFSPDGRFVSAASGNSTNVYTRDLSYLRTIGRHDAAVTSTAVSPDGRLLLSGSRDSTARLWDFESGLEKMRLRGHYDYAINAVAYSPDGRYVYTGGHDGTILKWPARPTARDQEKVLLIAGGATGSPDAAGVLAVAEYAHNVNTLRGIPPENILFLSAYPQGVLEGARDGDATLETLRAGLVPLLADARSLTVMLLGPGASSADFRLNANEVLTASELRQFLDDAQSGSDPLDEVLVYGDFGGAGNFISAIGSRRAIPSRTLVASTTGAGFAMYQGEGAFSFSSYFLSAALSGERLEEAFESASASLQVVSPYQRPWLDRGALTMKDEGDADLTASFVGRPDSQIRHRKPVVVNCAPDVMLEAPGDTLLWLETEEPADRAVAHLRRAGDTVRSVAMQAGEGNRWEVTLTAAEVAAVGTVDVVYEVARRESSLSTIELLAVPVLRRLSLVEPIVGTLPSQWYFAEGATVGGFETYLLLANIDTTPIPVEVNLLFDNRAPAVYTFSVPANGRETVRLNDLIDGAAMAIEVRSTDGRGFAAERVMYSTRSGQWTGGHASLGITTPSSTYYFAEGSASPSNGAGNHFQTFLLIANPNTVPAILDIVYTPESGPIVRNRITVPARSRYTLEPARQHVALRGKGFSTQITTLSTTPVVAERAMWWVDSRWDASTFAGGHASPGISALTTDWHFAQSSGATGSEFLLFLNPSNAPADVTIEYLMADSAKAIHQIQLPASSRRTLEVAKQLGSSVRHATRIRSSRPIAVEQSMYWSTESASPDDGDNTTGTTELGEQWLFAEGASFPSLQTEFAFSNPGIDPVTVSVRFMRSGKESVFHTFSIGAERTATVRAADFPGLSGEVFSTAIRSSAPIAVERSTSFGLGPTGGTTSGGIRLVAPSASPDVPTASTAPQTQSVAPVLPTPTPTPVPSPTPSIP